VARIAIDPFMLRSPPLPAPAAEPSPSDMTTLRDAAPTSDASPTGRARFARALARARAFELDPRHALYLALLLLALYAFGEQFRSVFVALCGEHNWRQADTYSVAYNFLHESSDFFHPRIDWTYGRSGVMGMEAPVYQYVVFLWMKVFGDGPWVARLVTWLFFAGGAVAAAFVLRPPGRASMSVAWLLVLALSPMALFEFRQVQPDPVMVATMMLAACAFHRYSTTERRSLFALGMVLYTTAVLMKGPALVAGPAMWLFSWTGKRTRLRAIALRGVLFAIPIALFVAWDQWAHHLNRTYNDGQVYFAIEFSLDKIKADLRNVGGLRHIFLFVLPVYASNWVLWPAVLAGAALGFRKENRGVAYGMWAWLAGAAFFLCAFSSRLHSHWYYATVLVPPVAYFAALGVGNVLELTRPLLRGEAPHAPASRWAGAFVVAAFLLTRVAGGEPLGGTYVPGATGAVPNATWLCDSGLFLLGLLQAGSIAVILYRPLAPRLERWLALALALAAFTVALPRALQDELEVFRWRTRKSEWRSFEADWKDTVRGMDRYSTRRDVFIADGPTPWFLHRALRKGFADERATIDGHGLDYYRERGARFLVHFKDVGDPPSVVSALPPLAEGRTWVLYCIDVNGCPVGR
jgi:4-amino-4-deoxy-L-arabinose transferase-like glycosyltransferase